MSNKNKSNEMWGGRFSEKSADLLTQINSSINIDKRLAFEDILGSKAHVEMLAKMNIITKKTKIKILSGLKKIEKDEYKVLELLEEIIGDIKNYELEIRIEKLESKFSKDLDENTFNEIRELKKSQKIN